MTPTLRGRIETRLALVVFVALPWTALVIPVAVVGSGVPLTDAYSMAFRAVLVLGLLGVAWELAYHAAQQLRWERDWPTLLGLLTACSEGALLYLVLRSGVAPGGDVPLRVFLVHFVTTWLVMWAAIHGPVRVLFPMWRFRGGRF